MNHQTSTRINLVTGSGMRFRRIPLVRMQDLPKIGDNLAETADGSRYVTEYVTQIVELGSGINENSTATNYDEWYSIWRIRTVGIDENELDYNEEYFIATKNDE